MYYNDHVNELHLSNNHTRFSSKTIGLCTMQRVVGGECITSYAAFAMRLYQNNQRSCLYHICIGYCI